MRNHRWFGPVLVAVQLGVLVGAAAAQAPVEQAGSTTPTVTLDRTSVAPGDPVEATLVGWPGRSVTLSVCGNQALRGSTDCNLPASEGRTLRRDGEPTRSVFPVGAPPVPCPCVLRASSLTNDLVAFAPLVIEGHPVGPLVEPEGFEPLDVAVEATPLGGGTVTALRSALGGPTPYEVTVTVKNRSAGVVPAVTLSGAVGRTRANDVVGIEFAGPRDLQPGETRVHTTRVELPAPAVGTFVWSATAAGAGPVAVAEDVTQRMPFLLIAVVVLFLGDVVAIVLRRRSKRRSAASVPA